MTILSFVLRMHKLGKDLASVVLTSAKKAFRQILSQEDPVFFNQESHEKDVVTCLL